ncbi:MAG: hypothetical protein KC442_09780 [Thermomicrobiales bacterium]|nr:hypothetical protein [Thermomicrobiales bacterium]
MEDHRFDLVLRQAAAPATRRSALAALLGSAVFLGDPEVSDANKKAQRRKARNRANRKRRRKQSRAASLLKPIKLSIINQGPNPITVEYGEFFPLKCCRSLGTHTFAPGVSEAMGTTTFSMFIWLNDRIWLDIVNLSLGPPYVSVAVGGQALHHDHQDFIYGNWGNWCCRTFGTEIVRDTELMAGRSTEFEIDGKYFQLFRDNDTNYKMYRLLLPPGL